MRLKDLGCLYSGLTGKSSEDFNVEDPSLGKPFVPFTNIFNNFRVNIEDVRYVVLEKGEEQNRIKNGDVLFLMSSEDYESIGKPSVVDADVDELYLNSFCRGLRIMRKDVCSGYVTYYLSAESIRQKLRLEARGFTRINLKIDRLASQEMILPLLSVQRQIVAYLDEKAAAIDARVAVLEKKLAAYKRLKTSMINEAVTKGLDKSVPLKDSGVEWVGAMPEGWKIMRLKDVVKCNCDVLPEDTKPDFEFDYVDIGSVKYGEGIISREHISFAEAPSRARRLVRADDIIVSTVRTYLKAAAKVPEFEVPLVVSTGFAVLKAVKCFYQYLNYLVLSERFVSVVEALSTGTGYPAINACNLTSIVVAVPPLTEQRAIAAHLDAECAKIDRAASIVEKQIDAYKRLKRSLINEVVTGSRKVA